MDVKFSKTFAYFVNEVSIPIYGTIRFFYYNLYIYIYIYI